MGTPGMQRTPRIRRGDVVYEVYVRSFADGNGDGVGDLRGLIARLPHIARLGVDAVWVTPVFVSPMADFGYDVADYTAIDPLFGTMVDADELIRTAHDLGLAVMFDLVLSHTSDQHAWFRESAASRDNPKADWYVWADPKPDGTPPNNWLSVFGGPAWQWHPKRRQYYLHNFLVSQPDLNFHHAPGRDAVLDVARFWLDRGLDGFRLDVVNYYVHDAALRSNPPAPAARALAVTSRANPYGWQDHVYDHTRPETLAFLERFRALTDSYGAVLMGELVTDRAPERQARAYTARGRLQSVYSFDLFAPGLSTDGLKAAVTRVLSALGRDGWVAWALSNHDVPRAVTRFGFDDVAEAAGPALMAVLLALRGSPCLYQGDELALPEADVPFEALQDPYGKAFWPEYKGRDGCRTPMPWDDAAPHAGFSGATPWLPVDPRHVARAAAIQDREAHAPLARVRALLALRRAVPALRTGTFRFLEAPAPVIAIERTLAGERVVIAVNLGRDAAAFPLAEVAGLQAAALPFPGTVDDPHVSLPPFGVVVAVTAPVPAFAGAGDR